MQLLKCRYGTRRLKSSVRLTWHRSKSRQRLVPAGETVQVVKAAKQLLDRRKVQTWALAAGGVNGGLALGERGERLRRRTACLYGQTRFVLSPPLAVLCTATGRAASGTLPAPPSRMRAATRNASISAFKPEICAWKMAIWFSFSFIASYILVIV